MGLPLAGVGKSPQGNPEGRLRPLVSWSGDVSYGAAEIANASAYPELRCIVQGLHSIGSPTEHAKTGGGWIVPSPETIQGFSAVCWMFGR